MMLWRVLKEESLWGKSKEFWGSLPFPCFTKKFDDSCTSVTASLVQYSCRVFALRLVSKIHQVFIPASRPIHHFRIKKET